MSGDVLKVYLAGPMSGIPQFNYPLFMEVAGNLRGLGYEVHNPAEMDDPEVQKISMASTDGAFTNGKVGRGTWGDFLSADVKIVADEVDAVVLLPGWQKSRGARLEAFVAYQIKKPVFAYQTHRVGFEAMQELPAELGMDDICIYTLDQGDVSRYG